MPMSTWWHTTDLWVRGECRSVARGTRLSHKPHTDRSISAAATCQQASLLLSSASLDNSAYLKYCSTHTVLLAILPAQCVLFGIFFSSVHPLGIGKGKGSSLDIVPFTILDSGALQPRNWQLIGTGCSTTAQASGCP